MAKNATIHADYADRLVSLQAKRWKSWLNIVNPYRHHLKKICQGAVLEVGCGIGRVLKFMPDRAVGVDHNLAAVHRCREAGLQVYSVDEFQLEFRNKPARFDCLLFSHILEHMDLPEAMSLIDAYLPYLKNGGVVVLITPQERGFRSDPTHVFFVRDAELSAIATRSNLALVRNYSFPFPRWVGRHFIYNEFVHISRK